jgi:hypothetical protein
MDQSIEVIGDPESVTETLRICFTPVDEQARIQAQQLAKDNDKPLRNSNVEIGFSRTDWEIGNVDDWYIECIIPKETFSMLTSIVTAGRLGELVLGFRMTHIYAEYDWPSTLRKWFLGPQSDASIDFPEQARGDVAFLRITEPEVILDYKAGPDKEATRSGVDDAGAPVPNLAASALDTLARNVAALHRTLTLVGVLTVACLAILALR